MRQKVRDAINAAVTASADAQNTRDQLCTYIRQHELSDSSHNLSQYVSLALYVTPPPELTNSVPLTEMPPDSTQVVELLPILRKFALQIDLHYIWISVRPQYDAIINSLHDALTKDGRQHQRLSEDAGQHHHRQPLRCRAGTAARPRPDQRPCLRSGLRRRHLTHAR